MLNCDTVIFTKCIINDKNKVEDSGKSFLSAERNFL